MKLIRSLDGIPAEALRGALSVGNFDGVHWGHAALLGRLRQMADRLNGPAVVATFDPHPAAILRPQSQPPRLTWIERRAELLERCGVDHVVVCQTDRAFLSLSAAEFFQQVVVDALQARGMVEGPNFFFGRGREGDVDRLKQLCAAADLQFQIAQPTEASGAMISSTLIREALIEGQIERANTLLTAPYAIRGLVTRGSARGAALGFPTANLTEIDTLIPAAGVYATRAHLDGRVLTAATHVGPNLTFGEQQEKVEVHLLDFAGDLYGMRLQVDFVRRVRDIARFDSTDALCRQMRADIRQVKLMALGT